MTGIYLFSNDIPDRMRRDLIFAGHFIVFRDVAALPDLRAYVGAAICKAFAPDDPLTAHRNLGRAEYLSIVDPLQKWFTNDPGVRQRTQQTLSDVGVEVDQTYCPWSPLRIQPPGDAHRDRATTWVGPHRDSWETNLFAQTNWWTPIYSIDADRCLSFFPGYWNRPIANTTDGWSFEAFCAARRQIADSGGSFEELIEAYPPTEPVEPVDPSEELRIVLEPNDILCFSASHLHGSVPNTSAVARFSTEFRTVHIDDLREDRGASNIDGRSTSLSFDTLYRLTDAEPLDREIDIDKAEYLARRSLGTDT